MIKLYLRLFLVFVGGFGCMPLALAQMIDNVELRREGLDAVAQVKFVTAVQYTRTVAARDGALAQIFYVVRPTQDQIVDITSERRLAARGVLPSMRITDESDNTAVQGGVSRKLVIRFGSPVKFHVRLGRSEFNIEIVLEGVGAAVSNSGVVESPSTTTAARRFYITLQSSKTPSVPLSASVPASLQAHEVFTASRIVNGQTHFDINVGYFATREDAQRALDLARSRFPEAVVAEMPTEAIASAILAPTPDTLTAGRNESQPALAPAGADLEASAAELLANAQMSFDSGKYADAIESLNKLLDYPPNASARRAQELAGLSWLNSGDSARAKSEFELFLKLYPSGADADRIRQLLGSMPSVSTASISTKAPSEPTSTTSGSFSTFYYGGKSDVRTREFKDSVLGGLPILQSDTTLSGVDQRQVQTNIDLNWRFRDTEKDMRFVFRDAYSVDMMPNGLSKERLSALYFDYRSLTNGTSVRIGRQSPNGGGVLYRFDGIQAGYVFRPKWKLNAVYGSPSDPLLDTRRSFYGLSIDAEALTNEISGSLYAIDQLIDGQTDRQAVGMDMRYFKGGFSASAQFDYDYLLRAVNIAAAQATWQVSESTMINAMVDRRTTPIMSLGNVLFFQDPALLAPARRIQELLGTTPIDVLREQVKGLTAYQTQARLGGTTAISEKWQTGADISVTNVDEIKPVAVLLPNGQASTGNLWSVGAQLIGTNLYSARDTHVFNVSMLGGPTYRGALLSYNNLSSVNEKWQIEPSLKYYTQTDDFGASTKSWTVGFRAVYRIHQQLALESELTYERAEAVSAPVGGTANSSSTSRFNYSFGGRFDF